MANMTTGSTVKLEWKDRQLVNMHAYAYIKIDDKKYPVIDLFHDTAGQWREFLMTEGLWVEQPPDDGE